jgi:hypothetical protein
MFGWFRPSERVRTLATDITVAAVERAQLAARLLTIDPTPTELEVSSMWFAGSEMMRMSNEAVSAPTPVQRAYQDVSRELFDQLCQDFLKTVCKSPLVLARDRGHIEASLGHPVPDEWRSPARFAELSEVFKVLTSNAMRLAATTVGISLARLTPSERRKARAYSAFLVARTPNLSRFEADTATRLTFEAFT